MIKVRTNIKCRLFERFRCNTDNFYENTISGNRPEIFGIPRKKIFDLNILEFI